MRIFVSAPLPGDAVERLRAVGEVVIGDVNEGIAGSAFSAVAGEIDAIVSMLTDRIDASLLARAPRLRVVANVAVGVDNIDLAACRARGVVVTNTPGVLSEATADLAFALLLSAARRVAEGDRMVRAGEFVKWMPTLLVGKAVHGSTLGIVGFGRIGQAMARRARGFGMRVLYNRREALSPDMERALGATYAPLDGLLAASDFVSLHCPLTPETRHIMSRARLASMKRGSILVNTARGPCVDEAALASALRDGPLAAAGLDVFEEEPRVHPELLALPNVVFTPHIGSADAATRLAMANMATDDAIAVLTGGTPRNPVT